MFASAARRRVTRPGASDHQFTGRLCRVYNPSVTRLPSAGVSAVSPSNMYRVLKMDDFNLNGR